MILNILLLIVGFVILIKGADYFVDGSSSLARNFKLSAMFIGLTIVSFGTSAPEFAVSIQSMLNGSGDIVLGNVVGSNILNILLIVGVSSIVHALNVKNNTVKKEIPIMILISVILSVLMCDKLFGAQTNSFSLQDGIVLCIVFGIFIYYLVSMMRNKKEEEDEIPTYKLPKTIIMIVLGLAGIILGSNFVVRGASEIAAALGVSERMISLTIVALGTSLPELVTSVTATKKGEYDIAIGNVVGSNIFNIGIVLGIPSVIFGGINNITISLIDIGVMLLAAVMLFLFSMRDKKINKWEGLAMLGVFFVYYSYVIASGIGVINL